MTAEDRMYVNSGRLAEMHDLTGRNHANDATLTVAMELHRREGVKIQKGIKLWWLAAATELNFEPAENEHSVCLQTGEITVVGRDADD